MNITKQKFIHEYYQLYNEIIHNNITAIKNILATGIDLNTILKPKDKMHEQIFPLLFAIKYASCKNIIRLLIEHGAKVNIQDNKGQTPLHYANRYNLPHSVEILIQNGADVNTQDNEGQTPLHYATSYNQDHSVEILIQNRADVNIQDNEGQTPLHYATRYNQDHSAEILIQNGANIDIQDKIGRTPLHCCTYAACLNHDINGGVHSYYKTIDILLHYKANTNIMLHCNIHTPFTIGMYANLDNAFTLFDHYSDYLLANTDKSKLAILYEGAIANLSLGIKKVESLLGMQIPINNTKPNDILTYAFKHQKPEIAKLLLLNGANINSIDPSYFTSYLHLASRDGYDEIVNILLLEGLDINAIDILGATALHYAASKGHTEIVKTLLNNNVKTNIKTHTKHSHYNNIEHIATTSTALDVAQYNNKTEVAKIIKNHISTPKSLCQLSRLTIRKCIKENPQNINIKQAVYDEQILIPTSLKNYVYNIIL
jgi:ankyrin repeat protein